MTTRPLVDPELLPMIDGPPLADLTTSPLSVFREGLARIYAALAPPPPDGVSQRMVTVAGPGGPLGLFVTTPTAKAAGLRPAILHVHGGGLVLGAADLGAAALGQRALDHDAVVVSVDYRLAPETPFPGPLEDCYAGLQWLFAEASALGVDPARVALLGESAGGGLAAALALLARDRGGRQPAGQVLVYPMLDHRTGTAAEPSPNPLVGEFGWTRAYNVFGWTAMRGAYAGDDGRIGHFSPSHAADLAGLPPAVIATGALDLFLEENIDYARRLMRAGVPAELHVYPGAIHAFDLMAHAAVARQFAADRRRALDRFLR
jgi:triacylglycerol lipase